MAVKISIIIVNYKVKDKLLACIKSIYDSKPKTDFEIIVVDNDEEKVIEKELSKEFPKVKYLKSKKNLGYGGGNNLGASYAEGEYLFFLNPDTFVFEKTIDLLAEFLKKNQRAGIASPLLVDNYKVPFKLQGTKKLNLLRGFICLSFFNKLFPDNHISKEYFLNEWDHKSNKEVDVCPGTAFMISSKLFKKIFGFDEQFFLYFEEDDISERVRVKGFKIFILLQAKIFHEVGASTKQFRNNKKIFAQSRFRYFKKYFGLTRALLLESFLRINKYSVFIAVLLISALLLRIHNLSQNMIFIGDQGWFYLSARDLLISGKIPLVGITSSHTWLHQGPLWTYMLSVVLFISKFNPVSGAYLTVFFGLLTVFLMNKLGSLMFSPKVGLIAAALYATSPLIIYFDRMPFDPSPIPFFTLLYFFSLIKWIKGDLKYFSFAIFLIAILYNLELATFTLAFPFGIIILYGLINRRKWAMDLLNRKILSIALIALLIPMLPIIIYDFFNGFKQTIVFLGWTIYKPFSFLIKHSSGNLTSNIGVVVNFLLLSLQKIIFQFNLGIALLIGVFSLFFLFYVNIKHFKLESSKFILLFLLTIALLGILVNQTPSDAYLPIVFPFLMFTVALLFEFLLNKKILRYLVLLILGIIVVSNSYASLKNDYGSDFEKRLDAVNKIIVLTKNSEFNLIGEGQNSQFQSFTMNYEYLLWWKGSAPSKKNEKLKIVVMEENGEIAIYKK